jgi:diacylglycerol O-acyltransferase / wax synthase
VDGQAAVALANAILDVTAVPRKIEIDPRKRQRTFRPEMTEMLRAALANQVQQVSNIVKNLPSTVGTLKDAAGVLLRGNGKSGADEVSNLSLAPNTPFNASVTSTRAFGTASLPMAELKAMGRVHEATVNDMVLMVCSGALRRYFAKKRALPRKSMVAAVPISLREKGDTSSNNQASMSLISLGTHIADPAKRLLHIKAATAAMKATMGSVKSILPTDFPSLGMPWLLEAATALYGKAKVADRIPQVANLVISNVPGPPMALYLAGARMLHNHPTSIVVHGMGLNVTVQSYDEWLDFGLMADGKAMPDVAEFAKCIDIAFDDIRALSLPGQESEERAPTSLARRAVKGVTGAVGGVVGGAVSAVAGRVTRAVADGLVAQAGKLVKPRLAVPAALGKATAAVSAAGSKVAKAGSGVAKATHGRGKSAGTAKARQR